MREQMQKRKKRGKKRAEKGGDPVSPWHRGQGDDPQLPSTETVEGGEKQEDTGQAI